MKRLNISLSDELYNELKTTHLNVSKICQIALKKALVQEWAKQEQIKLIAGLQDE